MTWDFGLNLQQLFISRKIPESMSKKATYIQPGQMSYEYAITNPLFESLSKFENIDLNTYVQPNEKRVALRGKKLAWLSDYLTTRYREQDIKKNLTHPDFIFATTSSADAINAVQASNPRIDSIYHIRSVRTLGLIHYDPQLGLMKNFINTDLGGKIQYPFLRAQVGYRKKACLNSTINICCSNYVRNMLSKFGAEAEVVYPPIHFKNYKVEYDSEGHIGMVNPKLYMKGGDIFLEIARELGDEKFLVCGSIMKPLKEKFESVDNVECMGQIDDMRKFYKKCKVVLVPSRWPEGFGRVAAEAMVSGIPVVVSNRGALPEVVGHTGSVVSEVESTKSWVEKIFDAIDNHDPDHQKKQVEIFRAERQINKFHGVIRKIV